MANFDLLESDDDSRETSVDRRTVMKALGVGAVASAGFAGTASAHEAIGKPAFYGTEKLSVCVSGNSGVLMARETEDGYDVGFVVGPNELEPYPDGKPRYSGNYTLSVADDDVPDGQIIGVQIAGTRWVNPNEVAQDALAAEREQLDSTHPRPEGLSVGQDDGLPCEGPPAAAPDVPLLNYALTLEHLEYAFYRDGLMAFSDDELMNADALSGFGATIRTAVPGYLATVRDHEKAHVDALTATIESLGGDPVAEGSYEFGYTTASEFFAVAQALENTGVAAYAGAAPQIVDNGLLTVAAGIHSVEARHASFLNVVNGDQPFPDAVDEAKSIDEVLGIAGGFVTSEVDPSVYELREYRPVHDRKRPDDTSDLDVLNYALTLEHLENAFYRDGIAEFSDSELRDADVLHQFDDGLRDLVPGYLRTVGDHEAAHVSAISDTIEALGGTPVEEATYDFGYETPSEFFGVAKALENTGVAAYAGAAPTVANDDVFNAAIGIHSVEARHAGFLNKLNGDSPFPDAVDEPKTMSEVGSIAAQFIVEE
ncbi:ferritin-like domain-containing protein [Halolamina sediminis]|uniref:ferritin-like domain-containing protein n=1 Tax=Halolamina sediminis TaxID=1480675 RepID=UPI000A52C217|nr:ferritin-like domain-containing protein [Halolamina sediminis]